MQLKFVQSKHLLHDKQNYTINKITRFIIMITIFDQTTDIVESRVSADIVYIHDRSL